MQRMRWSIKKQKQRGKRLREARWRENVEKYKCMYIYSCVFVCVIVSACMIVADWHSFKHVLQAAQRTCIQIAIRHTPFNSTKENFFVVIFYFQMTIENRIYKAYCCRSVIFVCVQFCSGVCVLYGTSTDRTEEKENERCVCVYERDANQ